MLKISYNSDLTKTEFLSNEPIGLIKESNKSNFTKEKFLKNRQKKKRPMEEPKSLHNEEMDINGKKRNQKNHQEKMKTPKIGEEKGNKEIKKIKNVVGIYRKTWEDKNEIDRYIYEKMIKKTEKIMDIRKTTYETISIDQKTKNEEITKGINKDHSGSQKTTWKEEYKQVWRKINGVKGYIGRTETKEGNNYDLTKAESSSSILNGVLWTPNEKEKSINLNFPINIRKGIISEPIKEKKNKGKGIIEIGGKIKEINRQIVWRSITKGNKTKNILTETNMKEDMGVNTAKEIGTMEIQQITDKTIETRITKNKQGKQIIQEGGIDKNVGKVLTQTIGGKGIEIEYSEIMKIKKKYKGEYINKAHIFEMLSGLCKKIIKWEEEKEIKEKIKNMIKKNIKTEKKDIKYDIQKNNPFITAEIEKKLILFTQNIKEKGIKKKIKKKENKSLERIRKEKEEQNKKEEKILEQQKKEEEIWPIKNWKKTEGKKINQGNTNLSIIPKRNKLTYIKEKQYTTQRDEGNITKKKVNLIKWISKAYILSIINNETINPLNKQTQNPLNMTREGANQNNNDLIKDTQKETIINEMLIENKIDQVKPIEYIMKTKNMYGALQYLKNYWKHIENKYFPKKGGKPTKKIQLISTSWNVSWLKEKGNKKCIIKRKLLEQKMKKIIEKQNKKPIISICKNKEGGNSGNKKMKNAKIIKEEIMFMDAVRTMENIKW
jgi:hypothetical protein